MTTTTWLEQQRRLRALASFDTRVPVAPTDSDPFSEDAADPFAEDAARGRRGALKRKILRGRWRDGCGQRLRIPR